MQIPRQGLGTQILDDVVMNRAGDGFAAWTQARDDGYQVEVAQFLPDSGWGLGIPVDQGVGFGQAKVARLEVSEAGDAFVVWTELVTPAEIWSNRFLSGKGWGSPTLLHRVDNARIVKMVTAMDERGNGIVLWSQGEPDPVNGGEVVPGVRVPLRDGDRICVGAWTVLTIRAYRPSGQRPVTE